jgi:hypothetical protein
MALAAVIIFKKGARPKDESWYVREVCNTIGLSSNRADSARAVLRCVDHEITCDYIIGFALASGYPPERCTITPFADLDGGNGVVLRVAF